MRRCANRSPISGSISSATTPEEFSAYIKAEIPKWTAIVKASGAKLD